MMKAVFFLMFLLWSFSGSAHPVEVSLGAAARVGYGHLSVKGSVAQRYKAGYIVARNEATQLFNNSIAVDGDHLPVLSNFGQYNLRRGGDVFLPTWIEDVEGFLRDVKLPTKLYLARNRAGVWQATVVNQPAHGDVLASLFAVDRPQENYAMLEQRDVAISSVDKVHAGDYCSFALDASVRAMLKVNPRVAWGLEAAWSFGVMQTKRFEDIVYTVPTGASSTCAALDGSRFSFPSSVEAYAYKFMGYQMLRGSALDVTVSDRQRFSLVLRFDMSEKVSLSLLAGMRYSMVEFRMHSGVLAYPYAHKSVLYTLEESPYVVPLDDMKSEAGVWSPVFGLSADYSRNLFSVGVGFEYNSFKIPSQKASLTVESPRSLRAADYAGVVGGSYGWHMSDVPELAFEFMHSAEVRNVALTLSASHKL